MTPRARSSRPVTPPNLANRPITRGLTSALAILSAGLVLALWLVLSLWLGPDAAAAVAAPAQLTAAAVPAAVVYPGSTVIAGSLNGDAGGVSGAALDLFQRAAGTVGEWTPAGRTTTATDGAFSFTVAPSASTDYQVRHPSGAAVPDASADVLVTVQPRLSISAPAGLWLGATVLLRGSVAPAHRAGSTVAIDRKVAGTWQQVLTTTLGDASRFTVPWTPSEFGYYRLRARMDADADHDLGVSPPRRVIVNRPNAHDVPMRYAHYIVIVRHEYRLYYYEHGALVRSFEAALGRPGYRTPLGLFHIYGKRKPAGGALGACAMFYRRQGGLAIHGTDQPYLIRRPSPRDFSHGCARMLNKQALWLYARSPVGTRVHNLR